MAATANGTAAAIVQDADGFYVNVSTTAPFKTLTIDTDSNAVVGMSSAGGLTVASPPLFRVSSGGALSIVDLNVDLPTKTVYGTVIGGNGLGTARGLALWNIGSVEAARYELGYDSSCGAYNDCPYLDVDIRLSGLTITPEARGKFAQALGLVSLGNSALNAVSDYGVITAAVPEPAGWLLMGLGLGLGGVLIAQRRGQGPAHPA